MKLAFLVSSAIDTNQGKGQNFPYSLNRSYFSVEERLRQTHGTLNSLRLIDPAADIFLIDVSSSAVDYKNELKYVPNLKFININQLDYEVGELCRNHPSKGLCETSAFITFLNHYKSVLSEYDFIVKITGRYFFSEFDKKILTYENKDKYISGKVRKFTWNPDWNYPEFLKEDDQLNWVPTWAYGVGGEKFNHYYNSYLKIWDFYQQNTDIAPYMDLECLFYEYMIKNQPLISAPWIINGWNGVSGKFFTE